MAPADDKVTQGMEGQTEGAPSTQRIISLKRKEVLTPATARTDLEDIVLSEVSQSQGTNTYIYSTYIRFLKLPNS